MADAIDKKITNEQKDAQKAQAEIAKQQQNEAKGEAEQDAIDSAALRAQLKAEILAELRAERELSSANSVEIVDEDGNEFSNEAVPGGRYKLGDIFVDANGKRLDG